MEWTDELKAQVIKTYQGMNPTAENSAELVKQIAEEMEASPNGVRMILQKAEVYVKKAPATKSSTSKSSSGEGTKRVSKEDQITALKEAIEAAGAKVDEEILGKLTGKAAAYFAEVVKAIQG